jgi:uncharacterized protein YggE
MSLARLGLVTLLFAAFAHGVQAQQLQTSGTLVAVPAYGEVKQANDEARITFMVEEQDKDKSVAASRVNRKMKDGAAIIRRQDPIASLQTRGYFTYPVYSDEATQPRSAAKPRQLVGWRVGQYIEVTTTMLDNLPRMVAAAQSTLALNGVAFGLTNTSYRKLEEQRITVAYSNLTDRITAIAKAMGRNVSDATVESIDFDTPGLFSGPQEAVAAKALRAPTQPQVEEPSFEPGETTISMRVLGKVRFK